MKLSDLTGPDAPATITVEQMGELLGLGRAAAYEAVQRGDIPSLKIGRRVLIPVPALLEMIGAKKEVTVEVPTELPELTPKAARLLLRILLDAAMKEETE